MVLLDKELQWVTLKKAIHTDLGILRHNQAYPGITLAYSGIFKTLCNPGIFRTVVYPEPWHIQNQKLIQNPGIFRTLEYSESPQIQNSDIFKKRSMKIVNVYNYFRSMSLPINAGIFKTRVIFRTLSNIYDKAFCKNSQWL